MTKTILTVFFLRHGVKTRVIALYNAYHRRPPTTYHLATIPHD